MEVSGQLGKWEFCVLMDEIVTLSIPWSDPHSILRKQGNSERQPSTTHLFFFSANLSLTNSIPCMPKVKLHTTLTGEESN